MKLFDLLTTIENDKTYWLLIKKGVIPISILDRKIYYEYYTDKIRTNKKRKAIELTAIEFDVTLMTVYNAIKFMEN